MSSQRIRKLDEEKEKKSQAGKEDNKNRPMKKI